MTRIARGGNVAVYKVSNTDSTLTISPNIGSVIASLNLGNANTWTTTQTFQSILFAADNTYSVGTATNRALAFNGGMFNVYHAASDANPTALLGDGLVGFGVGGATAFSEQWAHEGTNAFSAYTNNSGSMIERLRITGGAAQGSAPVTLFERLYLSGNSFPSNISFTGIAQDSDNGLILSTTGSGASGFRFWSSGVELFDISASGTIGYFDGQTLAGVGVPANMASTIGNAQVIGATSTVIKTFTPAYTGQYLVAVNIVASVGTTLSSLTITYVDNVTVTTVTITLATAVVMAINTALSFTCLINCRQGASNVISVQATALLANDLYGSCSIFEVSH